MDEEEQVLSLSHRNLECCEPFKFVCPSDGCGHEFLIRERVVQDVNFFLDCLNLQFYFISDSRS